MDMLFQLSSGLFTSTLECHRHNCGNCGVGKFH